MGHKGNPISHSTSLDCKAMRGAAFFLFTFQGERRDSAFEEGSIFSFHFESAPVRNETLKFLPMGG